MELDAFVAARGPLLIRTAFLLSGDPNLAEDLVQTTLEACWKRWQRIAKMDHPDAYVRRMLINAYLSYVRLRRNSEVPTASTNLDYQHHDTSTSVDDRDALRRVLDQLTQRERVVLVLRYYLDLDDAAIADTLGVTPSTVRSTASRALARARHLWFGSATSQTKGRDDGN